MKRVFEEAGTMLLEVLGFGMSLVGVMGLVAAVRQLGDAVMIAYGG